MSRLWIDSSVDIDATTGTTQVVSLITGFSTGDTRLSQMTLLRTIIGCDLANTVHDSGEGSQRVAIGIGVTSQAAFAAGVLPAPELATSFPSKPWVWRAMYRVWGVAADQPVVPHERIDLDIRAMRKLENGEVFLTMNNSTLEGVASTVKLIGYVRQLWLVG